MSIRDSYRPRDYNLSRKQIEFLRTLSPYYWIDGLIERLKIENIIHEPNFNMKTYNWLVKKFSVEDVFLYCK